MSNTKKAADDLAMHLTPDPEGDDGRVEPTLDLPEGDAVDAEYEETDFVGEADQAADDLVRDEPVLNEVESEPLPTQYRMVPRISIQAFCIGPDLGVAMQRAASDRRLSRTHSSVHMGGVQTAVEHFRNAPTPNLLIVEVEGAPENVLRELEYLAEVCDPGTNVVVIGHANDIQLYRQLIQQGVSEYIVAPVSPATIIDTISGMFIDPDAPMVGRNIVFTGVKGGVGASTIAHNAAWMISEHCNEDVTLVDLDLPFGTAGLDFNQDPVQGVADALLAPERLDDQLLERLLVRCSDRLSLFTAPGVLDRDFEMRSEAIDMVIDRVRETVPCVVVDLPHIWENWTRSVLLTADEIVVTATPDLASLRNTKNIVDLLKSARPNDNPPILVLNQVGVAKRPEIPVKEFTEAVGLSDAIVLPFEPQLFGSAANNGQMLSEIKPEARTSQSLLELAKQLSGKDAQMSDRSVARKFWDQLMGRD